MAGSQGSPPDGCGWRFFQDDKNAYVMTTKRVINMIQSRCDESEPIVRVKFRSHSFGDENIVTQLGGSVVVSSDEGSLLDYAVIKCGGIPSKGSSRKRFTIGKPCPPPAGTSIVCGDGDPEFTGSIIPYPSDLIEFLKKSNHFHATSEVSTGPLTRHDHAFLDEVERNKDIFLFNNFGIFSLGNHCGYPLCYSNLEVVGMLGSNMSINATPDTRPTHQRSLTHQPFGRYMIGIAVRIDKIIKDIYRKFPELATNIFPDFRDMC